MQKYSLFRSTAMEKKRELMKKKAINFPLNLRHRRHKAEKMSAADPMKNEILTLNWRMEDKHENDTISKMNRVIRTKLTETPPRRTPRQTWWCRWVSGGVKERVFLTWVTSSVPHHWVCRAGSQETGGGKCHPWPGVSESPAELSRYPAITAHRPRTGRGIASKLRDYSNISDVSIGEMRSFDLKALLERYCSHHHCITVTWLIRILVSPFNWTQTLVIL